MSGGAASAAGRGLLVVGEIAIAFVLLVGAGLLGRSFLRLQQVDPGFETSNILTVRFPPTGPRYQDDPAESGERINGFWRGWSRRCGNCRALRDEFRAIGAVHLGGEQYEFRHRGPARGQGTEPNAGLRFVSPGYLATLRIPLRAGRDFVERDDPHGAPVMLINEAFARQYFSGEDPIGKKLKLAGPATIRKEIVGVVGMCFIAGSTVYSAARDVRPAGAMGAGGITLLVRATTPAASLVGPIRREIAAPIRRCPCWPSRRSMNTAATRWPWRASI